MQENLTSFFRFRLVAVLGIAFFGLLTGCGSKDEEIEKPLVKAHLGLTVSIALDDPALKAEYGPRATAWANRTGAELKFVSAAEADVRLVPPRKLGGLVVRGEILPVPSNLKSDTSDFNWGGLLRIYQSPLASWGGANFALPAIGEARVFVLRWDILNDAKFQTAFRARHERDPLPIRTWEDFAEVGTFAVTYRMTSSFAPLPKSDETALTAFAQIAACFDRPVYGGGRRDGDETADLYRRGLSFFAENETGEARLDAPAFREALNWFEQTAPARAKSGSEPLMSLVEGTCIAAVLPLSDLAQLPRNESGLVEPGYAVAPIPGCSRYFDSKGESQKSSGTNYVPYYSGNGYLGVVSKNAKNPEACWNLLQDFGGPAGSAAAFDAPILGAGPLRTIHATEENPFWRPYQFDTARTLELNKAIRHFVGVGTLNPAFALRTPDEAVFTQAIVGPLRKVAGGELSAEAGHKQIVDAIASHDAKIDPAIRKQERRNSAGME